MTSLKAAQDMPDTGYFRANITSQRTARPIPGAKITISDINNPENIIEELTTDEDGQTETISLQTPPLEYSMIPESSQPYSVYNVQIEAEGYEPREVSGAEILPGQTAIQNAELLPLAQAEPDSEELFVIPPHTLYGEYPPKIPEEEVKDVTQTGEIVLSRVVIPEFVIVHDGPPNDSSARNYYVRYKDYILHKLIFPHFTGLRSLFFTLLTICCTGKSVDYSIICYNSQCFKFCFRLTELVTQFLFFVLCFLNPLQIGVNINELFYIIFRVISLAALSRL